MNSVVLSENLSYADVQEDSFNESLWSTPSYLAEDFNDSAVLCNGFNFSLNGSVDCGPTPLPSFMEYNLERILSIIVYGILFFIAGIGNVTVLVILIRNRKRSRSRVNLLIMHLAIADCIVTFVMIPLEIGWAVTIEWLAGDIMCRIMSFWRQFGLCLSSFVLIAISLDRYFAVCHPLSVRNAGARAKLMLFFAWLLSIICSAPQVNGDGWRL